MIMKLEVFMIVLWELLVDRVGAKEGGLIEFRWNGKRL
jgi:hypothetical protein